MRILIISGQQAFRQNIQAACLRYPNETVSLRSAESIGQGLEFAEQFEAQIVFLDLTKNNEAGMLAVEALAKVENRLVVTSNDKMTAELLTRMIRAGAREVISQPIIEEEAHQIIDKAHAIFGNKKNAQPARTGKILISFSSKGGVGKTTLACNLAVMLNERFGSGNVALIDANTQAPNVAPMLDLRPQRWLRDAVMEYKRLDSELLKELMTVDQPSGLHVLAHSTENPLGLEFSEDQLDKILLVAKGTYQWTVVDTFPLLSSLNLSMMDLSDEIVLVTEPIVPALRSARHNLEMLQKAGYTESRISVVLNKYTKFSGNVEVDLVQETLNWPIKMVIPYDVHSTISANNGKALVNAYPDLEVTYAISRLVDSFTGENRQPPTPQDFVTRGIRTLKNWLAI